MTSTTILHPLCPLNPSYHVLSLYDNSSVIAGGGASLVHDAVMTPVDGKLSVMFNLSIDFVITVFVASSSLLFSSNVDFTFGTWKFQGEFFNTLKRLNVISVPTKHSKAFSCDAKLCCFKNYE